MIVLIFLSLIIECSAYLILMSSIKKYWVFKNWTNFTITVLGVSGFGLVFNSFRTERKFASSPVVSEAIKIIGFSPRVKDLLGSPISYSGSTGNTYLIQDNEQYFNFRARASRGTGTLQVSATGQKIKDILQKDKFKEIDQAIVESNTVIEESKQRLKKSSKEQKKLLQIEVKKAQDKIAELKKQKEELTENVREKLKKFYIPSEEMFISISKCKQPERVIPDDTVIYGIDALSVVLPNRNRINVIPPEQEDSSIPKLAESQKMISEFTEGYLKEKMESGFDLLTEQELAAYSKHKSTAMYSKYNSYRGLVFLMLAIGGILTSIYYHNYRLQPVTGTLMARQAQNFFFGHKDIKKIIQAANKSKGIKWEHTISGGIKKDDFECQASVQGISGGRVYFDGVRDEKNRNQYRKFIFEYKEGKQTKKIDLLV